MLVQLSATHQHHQTPTQRDLFSIGILLLLQTIEHNQKALNVRLLLLNINVLNPSPLTVFQGLSISTS